MLRWPGEFFRCRFAHQKHGFGAFQIAAFGQGSEARGRDVGRLRKVEFLQRLHPGQVRILEPQFDRAPFALFDLGLEQRFQVMEMGVVLLPGFFGEGCELGADGAQSQSLTVLRDAGGFHTHAGTSIVSNWLYSAIVGSGRS
jgi:hypothetical protein